jgi:hypothetical protein
MRRGAAAAAAVLAVAAACAAGEAAAARVFGKVKVEKDGALTLQEKKGPLALEVAEDAPVLVFRAKTLPEVEAGPACILAHKEEAHGPNSAAPNGIPAQISQVQLIVSGEGFEPPPVPADLAAKKIAWLKGSLHVVSANDTRLDGTIVSTGGPARVIVVEKGDAAELRKKGAVAVVEGPVDRAAKKVDAKKVAVCGPDVQPGEMKLLFGL